MKLNTKNLKLPSNYLGDNKLSINEIKSLMFSKEDIYRVWINPGILHK